MVFPNRNLSITSRYSTIDDGEYGDMSYSKRLLSDVKRKLPDSSHLRITDFKENFTKIKELGMGRFGSVAQYLNRKTNTFVVGKHVKMEMFDHWSQDWEILHNLSRKHDRIADFIGIYSDDMELIVFTEYLCNGSIKDKLEKGVGLSEKLSLKYFYQVCEGLHWLHDRANPVIHSDIKTANILITTFDDVKLANFGLVRDLAIDGFGVSVGSEVSFDFRGTMLYVAPEVITSELGPGNKNAYGKPADMWALGCTLIEMLVCHPPYFEYFGCVEEMQKEVRERANGPIDKQLPYESKVLCPTASQHIKFLIDKLFDKNPDTRITVSQLIKLKRKIDENSEQSIIDLYSLYDQLNLGSSQATLFSSDLNSSSSTIEMKYLRDKDDLDDDIVATEKEMSLKLPQKNIISRTISSSGLSSTKKEPKRKTINDVAICCAFFTSRFILFFRYYFQSLCYTTIFVILGIIILAAFFSITFGVIQGVRKAITSVCNCDLNQPQFLIISGIFFILLFALLFSCCMVAIGEYKFRMANRTLRRSKYFVKRPSHDLKLFGITIVRKEKDEDDSEDDDDDDNVKEIPKLYITSPSQQVSSNNKNNMLKDVVITEASVNKSLLSNNNDVTMDFYYN
ncbi:Protein kinase domain and Serine/threonine-/dual specificity protein kinase, catalytic domain and Protein kinase-like domain-containing protein [Strongyloides ratti]|uniref:non-specific serine/threonine protein kinase n=1 Tax=Strongyloides ratti TaxID=34506 RepID=A0A090MUK2_STRRB|nr:Protein kinase domain and Serine/threonine-/dual specificity protein kinase, catalytic domain and Protein kinase-like domain-containing protein [Strongyloides ratti]CEF62263.1 Protein kinase domain and Serine/threonine-/dual specificity protein kinase, catalytic domain and Protein kinase-like domain-containing protein [Strongyloides ratti]